MSWGAAVARKLWGPMEPLRAPGILREPAADALACIFCEEMRSWKIPGLFKYPESKRHKLYFEEKKKARKGSYELAKREYEQRLR